MGTEEDRDYDILIRKYDSDGQELWMVTHDGGVEAFARGVAVDAHDDIIVVGYTDNGNDLDIYIAKYTP